MQKPVAKGLHQEVPQAAQQDAQPAGGPLSGLTASLQHVLARSGDQRLAALAEELGQTNWHAAIAELSEGHTKAADEVSVRAQALLRGMELGGQRPQQLVDLLVATAMAPAVRVEACNALSVACQTHLCVRTLAEGIGALSSLDPADSDDTSRAVREEAAVMDLDHGAAVLWPLALKKLYDARDREVASAKAGGQAAPPASAAARACNALLVEDVLPYCTVDNAPTLLAALTSTRSHRHLGVETPVCALVSNALSHLSLVHNQHTSLLQRLDVLGPRWKAAASFGRLSVESVAGPLGGLTVLSAGSGWGAEVLREVQARVSTHLHGVRSIADFAFRATRDAAVLGKGQQAEALLRHLLAAARLGLEALASRGFGHMQDDLGTTLSLLEGAHGAEACGGRLEAQVDALAHSLKALSVNLQAEKERADTEKADQLEAELARVQGGRKWGMFG